MVDFVIDNWHFFAESGKSTNLKYDIKELGGSFIKHMGI